MADIFKFDSGELAGKSVRVTRIDGKAYVSVLDVIGVACEQSRSAACSEYLSNIKKSHPEVINFLGHFKFRGQGQRETPVTDARGLVKVLMLLPGAKAAKFREAAADTLVRYLGGDETLVAEIRAIRAEAEANPDSAPAFFRSQVDDPAAGAAPQNPQETDELERAERRMALRERELELRAREQDLRARDLEIQEKQVKFLVEVRAHLPTFGLDRDPRIKASLADQIQNVVLATSAAVSGPTAIEGAQAQAAQALPGAMTIAAYLKMRYNASHDLDTRISSWIGRKAAALYRGKYGVANPHKTIKFVCGESRSVMVYPEQDYALIDEAIDAAVAASVFDPTNLRYSL